MNYLRIAVLPFVIYLGYWIIFRSLRYIFLPLPLTVAVDGILNICSGFGIFFIGLYLMLYWLKKTFKLSINIGNANKIAIFLLLFISPLLTTITYQQIHTRLDKYSYIECRHLREISTRYSSRTYTKTPGLCTKLVDE